jgi:hypothetical protein
VGLVRRPDAPRHTAHTLIVKDLGLCGILWVDAVELERETLALVLGVGDLDDGLCVGRLCPCGVCGVYNDILLDLGVEERANASDHANAHDCCLLAVSLAVSSSARRWCGGGFRLVVVVVVTAVKEAEGENAVG